MFLPSSCCSAAAGAGGAAAGYDKPWRQNMAGKGGAAAGGKGAGAAGGANAGAAANRKQYIGPDQELATMLERDIIDEGINIG